MLSLKRWMPGRVLGLLAAVGLTVSLGACGDLLGTDDPDAVTTETAQGPSAVPVVKNGIIGSFQGAYDDYVLYTGMLTDEYILAGTFPTRTQVDQRDIGADNATLNGDMWEPLQATLQQAKSADATWTANQGNAAWVNAGVQSALPVARFYAGYTTLLIAEAYCRTVLNPRGQVVQPTAAADSAIAWLQRAESAAVAAGRTDIERASIVGQARAEAFKGNLGAAASLVSGIPDDFVFRAEYSANTVGQENDIFQFTYEINEALRWTVGDSSQSSRGFEEYAYYNEWDSLDMILNPSQNSLTSFDSSIPVNLQQAQNSRVAQIPIASGWEANMYEIENDLRSGSGTPGADANALIGSGTSPMALAVTNQFDGLSFPPSGSFAPASFGATFDAATADELGRVRQIGLWQSGTRLGYLRRLIDNDGINVWPPRTDTPSNPDTCFPITQQEIDNNPNVDPI